MCSIAIKTQECSFTIEYFFEFNFFFEFKKYFLNSKNIFEFKFFEFEKYLEEWAVEQMKRAQLLSKHKSELKKMMLEENRFGPAMKPMSEAECLTTSL